MKSYMNSTNINNFLSKNMSVLVLMISSVPNAFFTLVRVSTYPKCYPLKNNIIDKIKI